MAASDAKVEPASCDCKYPCSCVSFRGKLYESRDAVIAALVAAELQPPTPALSDEVRGKLDELGDELEDRCGCELVACRDCSLANILRDLARNVPWKAIADLAQKIDEAMDDCDAGFVLADAELLRTLASQEQGGEANA